MSTPAQHTYQSSAPWWVVAVIVSVGVALSLSVILALTWWREKQVDQHLHVAATQATTLAADAINTHLQHQRHLLELFTREHAAALDAVIAAPGDARLKKALESATLGYFPDAFAHTLSSADGTILLENHEGLVGERCRENIRTFAATSNQHLVLHPNPLKPHYDVMTQYGRHVLFVSFQPGPLSALLTKHQPEMVKLMIVQPKSLSWTRPSVRFWRCLARRDDEEWSFHSEEEQRRQAMPKPCNRVCSGPPNG